MKNLNKKKTVSFHTLGCRLNFFETDGIASVLQKNGYTIVKEKENAEVIVINTCTVTNNADSKNRNVIRNYVKRFPSSDIWVTGCYAETDREEITSIPGIKGVVGNQEKSKLPYKILETFTDEKIEDTDLNFLDRFSYTNTLPFGHTRSYLKIQDGCNRKCSYCKIPQARGLGVSRNFDDIIENVKFLDENLVPEIVVTGVNIGWYRDQFGKKSFIKLLEKILNTIQYTRLRISSIEPSDVSLELSELLQHPRFCNFLHVPLQSGSAKILKKMRRSYFPESFEKRIEIIKSKNPDIFLGTDVIVGFPGEEEVDFLDSLQLLKKLEFAKIHAFPYSPRKNTVASNFDDQITGSIKKERMKRLNDCSIELHKQYSLKEIGKIKEGVVENDGCVVTDNYLKVNILDDVTSYIGKFLSVKLLTYKDIVQKEGILIGEIC